MPDTVTAPRDALKNEELSRHTFATAAPKREEEGRNQVLFPLLPQEKEVGKQEGSPRFPNGCCGPHPSFLQPPKEPISTCQTGACIVYYGQPFLPSLFFRHELLIDVTPRLPLQTQSQSQSWPQTCYLSNSKSMMIRRNRLHTIAQKKDGGKGKK